jgi:hypothetical protein
MPSAIARDGAAAVVQRTLHEKPSALGIGVESLSDREMQVFQLLGASYSAREIDDSVGRLKLFPR